MKSLLILVLVLFTAFSATAQKKKKPKFNYLTNSKTTEEIIALPNKQEKLYYMMIGHFTNKKQADTTKNPLLKEQESIVVPIWRKQRPNEYWTLMSWYLGNSIETPIAQFVSKINKKDRDTFQIEIYGLPKEYWGTTWKDEDPLASLKPQDLVKMGCVHYAYLIGTDQFQLMLPEGAELCESSESTRPNIAFYSFETIFTPSTQTTYNTLYDKNKKALVTYKPFGNRFERIPKTEPKYLDILYPKKKK